MIRIESIKKKTNRLNGVIGLDFNENMVAAVETDKAGNIVNIAKYEILKKRGQIKEVVNKILKEGIRLSKDIIIENLDFSKTKSKIIKAKSKKREDI